MIPARRVQLEFGDEFITGFVNEQPQDLWEPWMRHADQALLEEQLLEIIQAAWNRHCKKSRTRGRPGTPAEVILRLLLLKHIRDWSYEELAREVRANFVYRQFTRIGGGVVPDDKSISRFGRQLGPEVVEQLHRRVVSIAREKKIVAGRKLRVDTTVVETNIHYPTDSTLLSDGVRVLTRVMKKVSHVVGAAATRLRDRTKSVRHRMLEIARASRDKSEKGKQKLVTAYRKLLDTASRVVGQAKKFSAELAFKRRVVLRRAKRQLDEMIPRMQQVIRQTRQRVLKGTPEPKARSSACLSRRPRSSAKARRESPLSSASWSRSRRPRTRSSSTTKSLPNDPATRRY